MQYSDIIHIKFFKNFKVKFFSFLCALFLWFYIVSGNIFEHSFDVPVRIKNKPEGWVVAKEIPSKVKAKFKGKGKHFLSFQYDEKFIELDLKGKTQTIRFNIQPDMIRGINNDLEIQPLEDIHPDTIIVQLDRFMRKKVPIQSKLEIKELNGYTQVGDVQFDVDSITISGPRLKVNQINNVYTEYVEYNRVVKDLSGKVKIEPSKFSTVHYSLNTVHFKVDIQRIGEIVFNRIPVKLINVPKDIEVKAIPSTLSLKLQGGVDLLNSIEKEDILAHIDFSTRFRYQLDKIPATILVPDDINFTDVKPQYFELVVER
ncbi:MAG: hypothetical protein R6V04_09895 [bacterium]